MRGGRCGKRSDSSGGSSSSSHPSIASGYLERPLLRGTIIMMGSAT